MMSRHKRIELTLDKKVELIKSSNGKSHRQLANMYGIGRTQVGTILKRKTEFLNAYEKNIEPSRKRLKCGIQYPDIDKLTWEWVQHARSLNIAITGPLLQERARQFAILLGHTDFKGSSGWLDSFKYRHNIVSSALSSWKEKLADICDAYDPRDIWNMSETALMFRALPDRELTGKRLKEHLTVCLSCNMAGEFEVPLVIGKAAKPNGFHKLDTDQLPVMWRSNKQTWMTSTIFNEWLHFFNSRMCGRGRNVLLFVETTPCHPHDTQPLSNVKVVFLPANAPSILQPLDQGIIQNVKQHYRKRFLWQVITDVGNYDSLAEIIKNIDVLNAIHLINSAIKDVKPSVVMNCFARAGFPSLMDTSDNQEDNISLAQLLLQTCEILNLPEPITDPAEYVSIDSDMPVRETPCADWDDTVVKDIAYDRNCDTPDLTDDNDDEETAAEPTEHISITEAIRLIAKVKMFCIQHGLDIWQSVANIENELKACMVQDKCSYKQTVLTSYFNKE